MICPIIKHFLRINKNGTIGKCGHMNNHKGFDSVEELENSEWLQRVKSDFENGQWPKECVRCEQTEQSHGESIRLKSIERHKLLQPLHKDYLVVGGILDNVCNSACQTCNSSLSTKIGSLESRDYIRLNNYETFFKIPQDRIVELDVNGGEPTASKNYKKLLSNLPSNIRIVRINTNGSRMIPEVETLLENNIMVIITLSLDGVDSIHDYVRWPILWSNYSKIVDAYLELQKKYKLLKLDFWTTVSCLNVANLAAIQKYAIAKGIPHAWSYLTDPVVYDIRYQNKFTNKATVFDPAITSLLGTKEDNNKKLELYIKIQDSLRKIDINDYFNLVPNLSKNS
jgi:sulfatase maturation enzyme AslB (radical SAM superfamily)